MPKFKVLLFISCLSAGGAERQMLTLARELGRMPHVEVRLCLIHRGGALESQAQDVQIHHLSNAACWRRQDVLPAAWRLMRICRSFRPHAVYSFEPLTNEMAFLAAKACGAHIYWGIRCSLGMPTRFSALQRMARRVEAMLSPLVDGIISNSVAGARDHADVGYATRHMQVIANGVDSRFTPDATAGLRLRKELGIAPEIPVLGFVSRNTAVKDIPTFEAAVRRVRETMPQTHVLCTGKGMSTIATDMPNSHVHRQEFCADMPALYNACTCTVLSSVDEGLPNALVESMACGTPCACTDAGDSAIVVGDTGLVSPVGHAEGLAHNILHLLSEAQHNPVAWTQRKEAARQRAVDNYSVQTMLQKTYHIFHNSSN